MDTVAQLKRALEGRYDVERELGAGGMATVYLARDLKHHRRVALKVLRPDLGALLGVERFLSEIRVTANLQHPNLLPLFDSGEANGLLFYVMPFIEGETLRARLEREKQLPIDEAIRITTAVASALEYAHSQGVIHRDLKPENILVHAGQPVIADFGIALAVANAGGNRITATGLSLGTPQYMSPEQATGDRNIDRRTDIYSLGAIVYEMLAGEAPHVGATAQAIISRLLTEAPRSLRVTRPNVPEHVDAAVMRALERLPADRFANAQELADALTGKATFVRAPPTATTKTSRVWRFAWPAATAASLAVAVWMAVRANRSAPTFVAAEFTVQLPDSLTIARRATTGVTAVALSRDGSLLVFKASRPGGAPSLYMRRLGDTTAQLIAGTEWETAMTPALSPDGEEMVVGSGGSVKRMSLRGGTAQTIARAGAYPSWGDAGSIVYASANKLWIVPEDGGPSRLLAAPDSARRDQSYHFPNILPGGKAALISIWKHGGADDSLTLGVVTIPGGKVTELGIQGTYPRYSATGHLLYATLDNELFAVPFSARTLRTDGQPFLVAQGVQVGIDRAAGFAVSANGTLAYVGGPLAWPDRYIVAVSRTGVERRLDVRAGFYESPRVSPDGNQIAFTTYTRGWYGGTGPNPDIWRFDLRSKAVSRVTTDSASIHPVWSADGARIANTRNGGDSLVMWRPIDATGPATPLVRSTRRIETVAMGPAHGYIAIAINGGVNKSRDVMIAHSDSLLPPRPLLAEPYNEYNPRISPDGKLIAYVTNRTGRDEIYVRALQGSGPEVQVSVDGGGEPVWAANSRELFYRNRPVRWMMSARLADGPRLDIVRRDSLFRDTYVPYSQTTYDVFPDGKEFVMLRNVESAQAAKITLIVVVNWTARSKAQASAREQ